MSEYHGRIIAFCQVLLIQMTEYSLLIAMVKRLFHCFGLVKRAIYCAIYICQTYDPQNCLTYGSKFPLDEQGVNIVT